MFNPSGDASRRYLEMRSHGLYGTSGLKAQFALVYAFCQVELALRHPGVRHVILLNNLSSFTGRRERAGEFGDYILAVDVPLTKIFFHCGLLPGVLQGEDRFLVIGGVVDVSLSTL